MPVLVGSLFSLLLLCQCQTLFAGVEVLLIDTDHHQPLFVLDRLLQARMKQFMAKTPGLKLNPSLVESSVKDAMSRLTILNVYDSTNLLTALLALDTVNNSQVCISSLSFATACLPNV